MCRLAVLASVIAAAGLVLVVTFTLAHAGAAPATVETEVLDSAGIVLTGAMVAAGQPVRLRAVVRGGEILPTGSATFAWYDNATCGGDSSDLGGAALTIGVQDIDESADVANTAGWDSATSWNANGVDQFATNWFGGLFAGNDNSFFTSSSMAWRFTSLALSRGDTVHRAYLLLRIRKTRPSLASEGTWTWKTVLATDTRSGADFAGETRLSFLARFNARGATWRVPLTPAVVDAFGTSNGAEYAQTADLGPLVQTRIADDTWTKGGAIAIGVLNDGTSGIAEAEVIDQPANAVLHIEWTHAQPVGIATSLVFTPSLGAHSYRARYTGDGTYAASGGPCMPLSVIPPSVGGTAEMPEVQPIATSASETTGWTLLSSVAGRRCCSQPSHQGTGSRAVTLVEAFYL